ncbi:Na/Pi cotransporter family protein [Sporomusa aerivorans]|uniref:Na/Pi cotransporter family protein n=1 Tax=Sporomusa aerivorans TaxID=204936 RepID=UPI00352B53B1
MVTVLAGLSLLLGGIFIMRYGLQKALWRRLQAALEQLTKTPWRGFVLGTAAAALLQSSTTVCLITIGLVSADYISFRQALGIILGANVGTCSTLQLVSMEVPLAYTLPLLAAAIMLTAFRPFRYAGIALSGLLSMFIGLDLLVAGIARLSGSGELAELLVLARSNPLYGIWGGIITTLVFQSSSAATALLMVLADMGLLDAGTAAYVVYGNNIGSCVSSVVFSAAAPLAARRVALAHIVLNVAGVIFFYPLTPLLIAAAEFLSPDFSGQIAAMHTLFNLLSSLAVLPLFNQFVRLVVFLLPGRR